MDTELFLSMLRMESTSGSEMEFSEFLASALKTPECTLEKFDVGDGTQNLLFSWGTPEVVFCTHMDTVPPYIAPTVETLENGDVRFRGRGTCDAKGQIFCQWSACQELHKMGYTGFGLLLLSGEETGSFGAKAFRGQWPGARLVVVGEPTDNRMTSASKGTKSFSLTFKGRPCHSGYPHMGESAVEKFIYFCNALNDTYRFPVDPVLGPTTWNIGMLSSPNPQNILSEKLTCRIYFRTTFSSDALVTEFMSRLSKEDVEVTANGGDTPMEYSTLEGFETAPVAFGSDAPQLTNFQHKMLMGPGSILVAHRDEENILLSELETGMQNCIRVYKTVMQAGD